MRDPQEVVEELYDQIAEGGMAHVDLGNGFFVEVYYAKPPQLDWPYDVFRDLAGKYLGYAGEVEVNGIALFAKRYQ